MASTPGFEPGPHWWEVSALTTAPPLLPNNKVATFVFVGSKTCNIAIQLVLEQCCKTSCTGFVASVWSKTRGGGRSPRPLTWIRRCLRHSPHKSGDFWNNLPPAFGPHETDPSESSRQKCICFKLLSRMLIFFVLDPTNLRRRYWRF